MAGLVYPISYKVDSSGLKKSESEFKQFAGSIKSILGAAGLAFGVSEVVNQLKEATKATVDDLKGQALLAQQLRATTGANDAQIASVERSIAAMQNQAAVADDKIRPAFAQLVRATGDVEKSTRIMQIALDVSAGTQKDLGAVTIALGKAYQGNSGALQKLGLNVKGVADPLGALAKQFKGAAEAAANNDPYAQIGIVMQNLQEQIGAYLLPALKDLAAYLSSSDFSNAMDNVFAGFDRIGMAMDNVKNALPGVKGALDKFFGSFKQGDWIKGIPVIGAWIDILAGGAATSNATRSNNAASARLNAQGLAWMSSQNKGTSGALTPLTSSTSKTTSATKALTDAQKAAAAAAKAHAKAVADAAAAAKKLYDDALQAYKDLADAATKFNTSFADTIAGFKEMAKTAPALGQFESQVVDNFKNITDAAQQAFDNKLITQTALNELTAYASKEQAVLAGIGRQRDELANKISLAQALYNDTKSAIVGFGNITSLLKSQTQTVQQTTTEILNGVSTTITKSVEIASQNDLVAEYKKIIDKTKAFATNLKALKAAGLDSNLFKQIVDAGVDAGGATAEAIIAGGGSTISELNSLFADLQTTGSQIAETTTVVMYNNGIDVVGGFIEGLKSQDALLAETATSMAATFANAFSLQINTAIKSALADATKGVSTPAMSDYFVAATAGLQGDALAKQIDMLTGADVSAPGSFMNTLGYMSASAPTVQVAAPQVVVNVGGKEIVSAIKTYERANGSVWVAA